MIKKIIYMVICLAVIGLFIASGVEFYNAQSTPPTPCSKAGQRIPADAVNIQKRGNGYVSFCLDGVKILKFHCPQGYGEAMVVLGKCVDDLPKTEGGIK